MPTARPRARRLPWGHGLPALSGPNRCGKRANEMNTDMTHAIAWPAPVLAHIRVNYGSGPADTWRLRLDPAGDGRVRTVLWDRPPTRRRPRLIDLQRPAGAHDLRALPGRHRAAPVRFHRDAAAGRRPAAVVGHRDRPDAGSRRAADDAVRVARARWRATLRTRLRRDQPAVATAIALEAQDADPLRALLRIGLSHIKPTVVRKPVGHRSDALQPSWAEGVLHAPLLVN